MEFLVQSMHHVHKYTAHWLLKLLSVAAAARVIFINWFMTADVFVSFFFLSSLHPSFCLQISSEKRASAEMMKPKPKPQKKKKKKDPNEPQKPVSAYALFFRDTQAAIKGQNPNATFGDVSKIVASMWDSLGEEQKQVQTMHVWNTCDEKERLFSVIHYHHTCYWAKNWSLSGRNYLHLQSPAHVPVQPVDGMCAAAGEQSFPGIMCCVITRTLLWDTAHLNELVPLFLKIIHPFIPTPLALIKNGFLSKFNSSKEKRGEEKKQSESKKAGHFTEKKWSIWKKYKHTWGDFRSLGLMLCSG